MNSASQVDVITFDHELVDLDQISALEARGVVVRPSARALRFAVDKGHQRRAFDAAGIPLPRFIVVTSSSDPMLKGFLDGVGPPVLKAARGGYDGRGVLFPQSRVEALAMIDELCAIDERRRRRATQPPRRGRPRRRSRRQREYASYPLVSTVQSKGMCVEVRYPADVDESTVLEANRLGRKIANLVGAVGVLAIEFFVSDHGLVVNEIALRPHNTGHWTIEGARTSQFTNHLLAVSGRALGSTEAIVDGGGHGERRRCRRTRARSSARRRSPARTCTTTASRGARAQARSRHRRGRRRARGARDSMGERAGVRHEDTGDVVQPVVGIVMGSSSDLEVMNGAAAILERFGVASEVHVVSAHRTPEAMVEYGLNARSRGLRVLIAGAGGAAHLPGMLAAVTTLPVIGVPVALAQLDGLDSLLSIAQMPRGVPVATVAINGATNAGLLARAHPLAR